MSLHGPGVVTHIAINHIPLSSTLRFGRTTALQVQGSASFEWLWLILALCAGINGVLYVSKFRKDRRESQQASVWKCLQILSLRGNLVGRFVNEWRCNTMNSRPNGKHFHPGDMAIEFSKPVLSCGKRAMYYMLVVLTMVFVSLPSFVYVLLQR